MLQPTSSSLVGFVVDPTRAVALAAYWPGTGLPYYSWTRDAWTASCTADCLLPVQPDPASVCGDMVAIRLPTTLLAAGATVLLQAVAVDASGRPVETLDCETLAPLAR